MIVSWNWLTQYVRLDMPVETLTERLALSGLNHESTSEVGGDLAIDLEVTSNRPDCLSHIGVAREIAVLFDRRIAEPAARPVERGAAVATLTSVQVEAPDLCPRFTARLVSGAKIAESPWWLRKRLETLGVRPISNVVDVTNYVMFECGQPLHAYDLDRLAGHRLVVRRARAGETLTAINNKVYELNPEMLAIADAHRPVGLAGVMGGLDTEIGPGTSNVLIEAAQFDATSVRRTSRALGLHSPSSFRFERTLDPERTDWASRRCAELILDLAGGTLHTGLIDVGNPPAERPIITLRNGQIERVLGIVIDPDRVISILQKLGLERVGAWAFRPPSWRGDLEREIDLIEEVARIHGYEHIPEDRAVPLVSTPRGHREQVEDEVRSLLTGVGFDEAATFSLVEDRLIIPLQPNSPAPPLRADHSRRRRENALRQSLVPSLLAARAHNEAHGTPDAELFEIANVYLPRPSTMLPDEPARLGLVTGRDYFGLKAVIEALLDRLHVADVLHARPAALPPFAPGRAAELRLADAHLGYLGEVDSAQLEALELRGACSAAELSFDLLLERAQLVPRYRPLPPFPAIARDLSLVVPESLAWADLADAVRHAGGPTLESLAYLDTFQGGNLPPGWQSVHFGLRFRHPERTLTGDEADRAVKTIVEACAARFGATLRT
ncbi:MAG TPA: phenylalanine--tRNA ligase subunit beta [Isosphaeraceae bacterium]|jgi:phenylalanyl-tRNA synthetase beta chain|nr:phenylalanine--tRNA ligase subunit beta [Isosphaeraceae bacterium]